MADSRSALERFTAALADLVDDRARQIVDERIAHALEEYRSIGPDRPLDRNGAATFLGVSLAQFDRLRKIGAFPRPLMIGESPRWFRRELLQWLEAQREGEPQLRVVKANR